MPIDVASSSCCSLLIVIRLANIFIHPIPSIPLYQLPQGQETSLVSIKDEEVVPCMCSCSGDTPFKGSFLLNPEGSKYCFCPCACQDGGSTAPAGQDGQPGQPGQPGGHGGKGGRGGHGGRMLRGMNDEFEMRQLTESPEERELWFYGGRTGGGGGGGGGKITLCVVIENLKHRLFRFCFGRAMLWLSYMHIAVQRSFFIYPN